MWITSSFCGKFFHFCIFLGGCVIVNQAKQYWEAALPIIEKNFPSPITFQTFILPLKPLRMEQSIFYLQCDSKFMKEVVEKHHLDKLQEAISQVYGTKCQVQILLEGEIPQQNSQILSEAEKKSTAGNGSQFESPLCI